MTDHRDEAALTSALQRLRDAVRAGVPAPGSGALRRRADRRRVRRAAAGAAATVVAVAAVTTITFAIAPATVGPPAPAPRSVPASPTAEPAVPAPVPLTVLAVHPDARSLAIIDLATGTIREYPPQAHQLPTEFPIDGAMITPRGDVAVWPPGDTVYVVPDADFSRPPVELTTGQGGQATELRVVPAPGGSQLWIVRPGEPTRIDLFDVDTAQAQVSIESGLRLHPVAATGDSLILNAEELIENEQGDGMVTRPGSDRVLAAGTGGDLQQVATGSAVAVAGDVLATLDADRTTLRLTDLATGQDRVVQQPAPAGSWHTAGGPAMPGLWSPLPTVSARGELLMSVNRDLDANGQPASSTLSAISIAQGTTRHLADFEGGSPLATWSRDGSQVVLFPSTVEGNDVSWGAAVLQPGADRPGPALVAGAPPGHIVVGAD